MDQHFEQLGIRAQRDAQEQGRGLSAPVSTRRSVIARTALGIVLAVAPASSAACSGANFDIAESEDSGADTAPETSSEDSATMDVQIDSSPADADSGADTIVDAPVEAEAGPPPKLKVDPSLPCSKSMTYSSGSIDFARSGSNSNTCDAPGFSTTPPPGSFFILWTGGPSSPYTAKLTSVDAPMKITSRCSTYSKSAPPDLNQLKTEILDPTPNVWQSDENDAVAPSYSVTHAMPKQLENCANGQTIAFQF